MKGTGAKRNVCPGSCVSTGAKFPFAPVESAPMQTASEIPQYGSKGVGGCANPPRGRNYMSKGFIDCITGGSTPSTRALVLPTVLAKTVMNSVVSVCSSVCPLHPSVFSLTFKSLDLRSFVYYQVVILSFACCCFVKLTDNTVNDLFYSRFVVASAF